MHTELIGLNPLVWANYKATLCFLPPVHKHSDSVICLSVYFLFQFSLLLHYEEVSIAISHNVSSMLKNACLN